MLTEVRIRPGTATYKAIKAAIDKELDRTASREPNDRDIQLDVLVIQMGMRVAYSRRKGLRVVSERFDRLPFPEEDVLRVVIKHTTPQINANRLSQTASSYVNGEDPRNAQALRIFGDISQGHLVWRIQVRAFRLRDANLAFDHALDCGDLPVTNGGLQVSRSAPWSRVDGL